MKNKKKKTQQKKQSQETQETQDTQETQQSHKHNLEVTIIRPINTNQLLSPLTPNNIIQTIFTQRIIFFLIIIITKQQMYLKI